MIPKLLTPPFIKLCSDPLGFPPLRLTAWIQLWLTQHFADANNIQQLGLKERTWSDSEDTKISILPHTLWEPILTEHRPALIIKRQELKHVRLGIDNRLMGGLGSGPSGSGKQYYSTSMQGSHTIFCVAKESGEVEQLAAEVSEELLKFSPLMRRLLNFIRIEFVGMGEVSKLENASENFVVPVNMAYVFGKDWQVLSLDDPPLVRIKTLIQL